MEERLNKAGVKLVKSNQQGYLEYKGKCFPILNAKLIPVICCRQFGVKI